MRGHTHADHGNDSGDSDSGTSYILQDFAVLEALLYNYLVLYPTPPLLVWAEPLLLTPFKR